MAVSRHQNHFSHHVPLSVLSSTAPASLYTHDCDCPIAVGQDHLSSQYETPSMTEDEQREPCSANPSLSSKSRQHKCSSSSVETFIVKSDHALPLASGYPSSPEEPLRMPEKSFFTLMECSFVTYDFTAEEIPTMPFITACRWVG